MRLTRWVESSAGPEEAAYLMERVPAVGWHELATKTDLRDGLHYLGVELRSEMAGLEAKVERLSAKVDGLSARVDGLSAKVDGLGPSLMAEIHRSFRNQTWALVGTVIALGGVFVGAFAAIGH